jgi:ADP-heptose:LPS heptosyltransferase
MRILFVTSNRLGDAVLSTGLLDHLVRSYPMARITVVCGPVAAGIFDRMPNRERTIQLQKQRWRRHWLTLWAGVATTLWDLVVDVRGSAIALLVPARRRAEFRRSPGSKIAQLATVLRLSPPPLPVAWIDDADRRRVDMLLPAARPLVALAPTANWAPKVWPAERFATLFRSLASAFVPGAVPVVLGGPGATDAMMAAPLLDALPDAIDLTGRLTLPEISAVLARVAVFIGNDSGLMHMAAAVGAPTIGLFGPTDAATYGPAGAASIAVVSPDRTMGAITVARVVEVAQELLARIGVRALMAG